MSAKVLGPRGILAAFISFIIVLLIPSPILEQKMDYIDVFNATVNELVQDDPESHASKTIRKLLSARKSNNYYICIQQFLLRNGLKFYASPSDLDYLPCLEYLEENAFSEKAHRKHLKSNPIAYDYCYYIIAKEVMVIIEENREAR
jgi:hypothetical protein